MDLENFIVLDAESDGLLSTATKIHVVGAAYKVGEGWETTFTNDYNKMRELLTDPDKTIVGHNVIGFDVPLFEMILGIKVECSIIDSLPLSWYLEPKRIRHGLEEYGVHYGVPKPEIEDWKGLTYEEYANRVVEDVKINTNLFLDQLSKLRALYGNSNERIIRVIKYLMHKANCIRGQEVNPLTIDVDLCEKNLAFLQEVIDEKVEELKTILPPIAKTTKRTKPKNPYKKDGSLSKAGERWFDLLEKANLPEDYEGEVEVITKYDEPNPLSNTQIKNYLFSLGWEPKIFKDGANGKVPQLRDDDKNLCKSIMDLAKSHPELEALDGLSVAQHRVGILKGFLSSLINGNQVVAGVSKFARTLRMAHKKPCVNLPKPSAQYGDLIRSVIVAPEGYVLCGADVSSLENKTLQNAIYHLDREYVEEMNFPGFDSHLKLGRLAKLITEQEAEFYSWFKKFDAVERENKEDEMTALIEEGKENDLIKDLAVKSSKEMHEMFDDISLRRSKSKTCNYALTYNCGISKLAESAKMPFEKAEGVRNAYWEMNWAVKKYTDSLQTKMIGDEEWIYNPASGLWLYLASDHIKFSACNQNAGVKIFDLWVYFMMQEGITPSFQAHDEVLFKVKVEDKQEVEEKLRYAMEQVNDILGLPVPIEIDVQFGNSYAEVH